MKLDDAQAGFRLDRAVREQLLAAGRSASVREVRDALADGRIRLDGVRRAPGDRAKGGETIQADDFVERDRAQIRPAPSLSVVILYEDDTLLALDKPSGISTAPRFHDEPDTLLGAAVALRPEIAFAGPTLEGGLLHRLDRGTSGVVLFAKDPATRAIGREAFAQHRVLKHYQVLCHDPRRRLGAGLQIRLALVHATQERMRAGRAGEADVQPAASEVIDVVRCGAFAKTELATRTGRRHQVRVHLLAQRAPVLGDELYGAAPWPFSFPPRLCLHASRIELPGGPRIDSPFPAELDAAFAALTEAP